MHDENAGEEELINVIKTAQAKEFVDRLPGQLDYMILEDGKNLSGGQKQRLTIARALVGKPNLLILDDSASALDYATDAKLRKALKEDYDKGTVILVSQRAATIRHADRIIVLEDGRLSGIGKHEELLESCEIYREICLSQLSEEEVNRA
jgi:ATP-binding cassette subfamily B protein